MSSVKATSLYSIYKLLGVGLAVFVTMLLVLCYLMKILLCFWWS